MKTTSLVTLVAATGLILGTPANAADLGGGCCADLEERVAELEATTARKGNRIVSLQVYGFVSRGILHWDADAGPDGGGVLNDLTPGDDDLDDDTPGSDSDTVLIDEDGSRFGFTGSATLRPGWSAGYRIEIATDKIQGAPITLRHNHLWIESEQYGRVTLGEQSAATDGISHIVLANTYSDSGDYLGDQYTFLTGGSYRDFGGGRGDFLRYDSPSIYGFILSASWSNDPSSLTDYAYYPVGIDDDGFIEYGTSDEDYWDVTLRYSGEFNAFRVAAGIGYTEADGGDSQVLQGSASVMHIPSGIFVAFSAGELDLDGDDVEDEDYWYLTGGLERAFSARGKTTFYAEYGDYNDADSDEMWGLGVVQAIDAAAMDIYLQYRNVEEDDGDDAFTTVVLGTKIRF